MPDNAFRAQIRRAPFPAGPGLGGAAAGSPAIWTFQIDLTSEGYETANAILSADELERAGGFSFEQDRRRFVATRAGLRIILGTCSGLTPTALRFRYGPFGKPLLDNPTRSGLHFSVAHSSDRAIVAVTRHQNLGVDIERVRPIPALPAIVKYLFSRREREAILTDDAKAQQAFFYHWTLKEAWLKSVGVGLSGLLKDVEICRGPGGAPRMRQAAGAGESLPWRLHSWSPAPGFVAALAVALA